MKLMRRVERMGKYDVFEIVYLERLLRNIHVLA
jgi:hypothetical protein